MNRDKYCILLIEDDLDMHHAICAMLPEPQFVVTCCSTGPAGWKALHSGEFDLLLLDIMLATPSEGFHLCYELKDDQKLRDMPVIMISAIGQRTGMDYARELGSAYAPADAFLEKPFDAATLRKTVMSLLQSKASMT